MVQVDNPEVHLQRVDPAFEAVIQAAGPLQLRPPDEDPFNALARAIVFQQLAGRAARAIHGRFAALYDGRPTAQAVLATPSDQLRSVGLSTNKAASLLDLAQKSLDGTVPLDRLDELADDDIVARLSTVRGIGRWTAEMFLMFQLRRPDVWPVDDYGVRKGFALIHKLEAPPTPKALQPLGDVYRPHRSAAAWYCWRAVETILPSS